jgi:hypothetical protein
VVDNFARILIESPKRGDRPTISTLTLCPRYGKRANARKVYALIRSRIAIPQVDTVFDVVGVRVRTEYELTVDLRCSGVLIALVVSKQYRQLHRSNRSYAELAKADPDPAGIHDASARRYAEALQQR